MDLDFNDYSHEHVMRRVIENETTAREMAKRLLARGVFFVLTNAHGEEIPIDQAPFEILQDALWAVWHHCLSNASETVH